MVVLVGSERRRPISTVVDTKTPLPGGDWEGLVEIGIGGFRDARQAGDEGGYHFRGGGRERTTNAIFAGTDVESE